VVLDAAGAIAASYRKAHLFDVDVPQMACLVLLLLRYNAHVVLDASSSTAAAHRKVHLSHIFITISLSCSSSAAAAAAAA
jgi:predicted amidohydrolase